MRGEDHVYNFSVEGNENYFANGILVHNCKHAPATTWRKIIESCKGLRFGFDATPWSDDPERNEILRKLFRDTQFEIRRDELAGVLAHATVYMSTATDLHLQQRIDDQIERLFTDRKRYMQVSQPILRAMCAWEALTEIGICGNRARNDMAIMMAASGSPKYPTLVLVPRVTLRILQPVIERLRTRSLEDAEKASPRSDGRIQGREHPNHDRHLAGR